MNEFDPQAELSAGTTVLEASAGTGKTSTIAALAARYVADGRTSIRRLLVLTFSRDASRELRSRVRATFAESANDPSTTAEARQRLREALAEVDRASIMTIHEFCQAMVRSLGILAQQDPAATLIEDQGPLLREVAQDLYLSRYARDGRVPPFPYRDRDSPDASECRSGAIRLAIDAERDPLAKLVPANPEGSVAERLRFARDVRVEVAARKHRLGLMTFDDQLRRLFDCLTDPVTGPASAQRVRSQFSVVLVDEFQDTDPVQWEILRLAFHGHLPMVLIGDPKQAIYSFRGADVRSYLEACSLAEDRFTLSTNYRADGALVETLDQLFEGLSVGSGIAVQPVKTAHPGSRLRGPGGASPVELRTVADDQPVRAEDARARIVGDVVAEVRRTLAGGLLFESPTGSRPLAQVDIAVLVRTNKTGQAVTDALREAGIQVAFNGADSIFASPAADDWQRLLAAMATPRSALVRSAVLTSFFGRTDADLARADADTLGEWTAILRRWERVLARHGVAALFATASSELGFVEQVLAAPDGARLMTDLRHLAQLLHEAASSGQQSAAWLAEWLGEAMEGIDPSSERTRRLETDSDAVQVKTIHKAKGLQFPVVLLPDLADSYTPGDRDGRLTFHLDDGERVVDLGGVAAPGRSERFASHQAEESEDSLRTLYVALTRAQCRVVCWWARTPANTEASSLHRLLFRDRSFGPPARAYPIDHPPGDGNPADLAWLREIDGVTVAAVAPSPPTVPPPSVDQPAKLSLPGFDRQVDQTWRRTSYSGLTAGVHADAGRFVVPEATGLVDDEPDADSESAADPPSRSPLADLPGGAAFGSLVHALFEELDPFVSPGPDRDEELERRLLAVTHEVLPRLPLPGVGAAALAAALVPALVTPLGPLAGNRALCDIPGGDRLSEMSFDLPTTDVAGVTLREVADLLARLLPADDPLVDYPAALGTPGLAEQPLRGFITGSIDLLLRVREPAGDRFLVVDYKTNRLGGSNGAVEDYREPQLVEAMIASHYPLQALLYCVAVHRFLSWRLADYDPQRHLGGVLYLFVRGMPGAMATTETPPGVFSWQPPPALIVALSRLLSGGGDPS